MIESKYDFEERMLIALLAACSGRPLEELDIASTIEEIADATVDADLIDKAYAHFRQLVEYAFQVDIPDDAIDWNRKLPLWEIHSRIRDALVSQEYPKGP